MSPERAKIQAAQEKLDQLAKVSGPEEGNHQSTIVFVNERLTVALEKLQFVLENMFPHRTQEITQTLSDAQTGYVEPYQSSLRQENGEIISTYSTDNNRIVVQNELSRTIALADERLGASVYTLLFLAPKQRRVSGRERDRTYINYVKRFNLIGETTGKSAEDPIMQAIGTSMVTQIAKDLAVESINQLMRRIKDRQPSSDEAMLTPYLSGIKREVLAIRHHEAFIQLGRDVLQRLQRDHGISDDQLQLALDIAYAKSIGVKSNPEFISLLTPIMQMIGTGDWDGAIEHRNFLVTHFGGIVPPWRLREFQKKTQTYAYASFAELVTALRKHQLTLPTEAIPEAYRQFFQDIIAPKVAAAERTHELFIIRTSADLSTAILRSMYPRANAVEVKNNQQIFATNIYMPHKGEFVNDSFSRLFAEYVARLYFGYRHSPNPRQKIELLQGTITKIYAKWRAQANSTIDYTLHDYLRTMLLPKGVIITQDYRDLENFIDTLPITS